MIELNLLEKKQPIRLPYVLGVDLNELNLKMIGLALVLYYVPEMFIRNHFESDIASKVESNAQLTALNTKIAEEISKNTNIKSQLEAYNIQVTKLKDRSAQVDQILKIRTNPKKVLEKIARSMSDDIWFNFIQITDSNEISINGGAYSSRSIGEFITIINDSPFFASSITPAKQEHKVELLDGQSVSYEVFELKGKIQNYDMRSQ
jgi:Tfp pilus assembly protein PilN